jgi:hypothetical protein
VEVDRLELELVPDLGHVIEVLRDALVAHVWRGALREHTGHRANLNLVG